MSDQPPFRVEPPRLPRGRHRLPSEVVAENQRRRLLVGAGQALLERGYAALTVADVIEAAGVSRATFYANFDNKRDCVLAAHRDAFEQLLSVLVAACAGERQWPAKVRAAIFACLDFMAAEPGPACLLTLGAAVADTTLARQIADSNSHLAALLRDGRRRARPGPDMPDLIEEALIGGAAAIVGARVLDAEQARLGELAPELTELILTHYVGAKEATRVAGRQADRDRLRAVVPR